MKGNGFHFLGERWKGQGLPWTPAGFVCTVAAPPRAPTPASETSILGVLRASQTRLISLQHQGGRDPGFRHQRTPYPARHCTHLGAHGPIGADTRHSQHCWRTQQKGEAPCFLLRSLEGEDVTLEGMVAILAPQKARKAGSIAELPGDVIWATGLNQF